MSTLEIVECGFKAKGNKYILVFGPLDGTEFPERNFGWNDNGDGTFTGIFTAKNSVGTCFEFRTIKTLEKSKKEQLQNPSVVLDQTNKKYYCKVTIEKNKDATVTEKDIKGCFIGAP